MPIIRRKLTIAGKPVVVRLEKEFWNALEDICRSCGITTAEFGAVVNQNRGKVPLSSALTIAILSYYREMMKAVDSVRQRSLRPVTEIVGDSNIYMIAVGCNKENKEGNGENGNNNDHG